MRMLVTGVLIMAVAAAACSGSPPATPTDTDASASAAAVADSVLMRKHAAEMDSVMASVRTHTAAMKSAPAEWPTRMSEHVQRVGGLLAMMQRHMSEMGMHASNGSHGHAGHSGGHSMMGGGADHSAMMTAAAQLRAELETLQTASSAELGASMPAHLQRVDEFLALMTANHTQHHRQH
jgi:hypothetical protein